VVPGGDVEHSPSKGLRYDGLFRVAEFWHVPSRNGFRVWQFRLIAHGETAEAPDLDDVEEAGPVARLPTTIQRLVRSTANAQKVKALHDYTCQICGIRIGTPAGAYAEAAHIRGLGKPHNGRDVQSNMLCLCPNHHVMFDAGAIYVDSSWVVRYSEDRNVIGTLRRIADHVIDSRHLAYHRAHHVP